MGRSRLRALRLLLALCLAASAIVVVGGAVPAAACSCGRVSAEKGLRSAPIVFLGEPVEVVRFGPSPNAGSDDATIEDSSGGFLTKFEVDRVYKGKVGRFQWVLTSAGFGGACGYKFDRQPYVISSGRVRKRYFPEAALQRVEPKDRVAVQRSVGTNLCGMMNEPSVGDVEDILGDGHEPR